MFVPSKCAFSTLQALVQSPSIPDLRRKNKAEFAASQFSSTKSLFQFFSGCCFALPASRDSDLVQPMQSRTSSTKKGRSISSKSAAAASSPSSRRPVVPRDLEIGIGTEVGFSNRRDVEISPFLVVNRLDEIAPPLAGPNHVRFRIQKAQKVGCDSEISLAFRPAVAIMRHAA